MRAHILACLMLCAGACTDEAVRQEEEPCARLLADYKEARDSLASMHAALAVGAADEADMKEVVARFIQTRDAATACK